MAAMATRMMANMTPAQLQSMMASQGVNLTEAQAKQFTSIMSKIQPHHLQYLTR